MLFDSPAYFLFLIPVVLLYWRLNQRAQNIFLLLASYFFYGWWDWRFLALMIGSTTVDYLIAQKIAPSRADPHRRQWFIFSIVLNFTILGMFKYSDFFRPHSQMRRRRQLRRSGKRGFWRAIRPVKLLARIAWNLRVYLAGLRGLQRLQRHRARQRTIAGFPFYGQFPPAFPLQSSPGILAPLAHQPEHLAPRLLVHSSGRKRSWAMENRPESLHYDGSRRPLARRKLDIRHLWRHSRSRAGRGALFLSCPVQINAAGCSSTLPWLLNTLGPENSHV